MPPVGMCVRYGQLGWRGVIGLAGERSDESSARAVRPLNKRKRAGVRFSTGSVNTWESVERSESSRKAQVIVIAGPTAVGKTSLALALAKRLGGEIISADSVQVYKGLDVGSAKTPVKERHGIPHHLLDIVLPTDEYGAGRYYDDAREATAKVLAKGLVPIVVGGAGMYLSWYIHGKPDIPRSSQQQVAAVDSQLSDLRRDGGGWDEAVKVLAEAGDPETARSLTRNDWYRLRRSLEIVKATGYPRAVALAVSDTSGSVDVSNANKPRYLYCAGQALDYDFRCYFLYKPREELYQQIDLRCEQMVLEGLLQEASALLDLGIQPNSSPPSRAIGYRQAMHFLSACRARGGVASEEQLYDFLATFQTASRNFVKRQLTWFRSEPLFRWVNASQQLENTTRILADDYSGLCAVDKVDSRLKETSYGEGKHYKTHLKCLNSPAACAIVIDWIRRTQTSPPNLKTG